MKVAVLSMDVEDWYHLDYFRGMACDRDRSLLDGVDVYREILSSHGVASTFFVLGELVRRHRPLLAELARDGHEIAAHGWDHTRPLTLSIKELSVDVERTREALEDLLGTPVLGYRAPCFSLDRGRLDLLRDAGFAYDSSRMPFDAHPLYGSIDVEGFTRLSPNVYRRGHFVEFQLSALPVAGRVLPVSGGAYMRIFPWLLTKRLVKSYLEQNELYVFYVHPFELSGRPTPRLPAQAGRATRLRFGLGRSSVARKLSGLIALLKEKRFRFTTFAELRQELLEDVSGSDV